MMYDEHVILVIMVIYTASGICTCCSFGRGISLSPHTNKLASILSSACDHSYFTASMSHLTSAVAQLPAVCVV